MSTAVCPTLEVSLPDSTALLPDDPAVHQQMIRELLDVLQQTRHETEQLQHLLDLVGEISGGARRGAAARLDPLRRQVG
jgi:hypothetical protein